MFYVLLDQGVCGNMIGNRNCSKDSFCKVRRGRFLDSCTCNDGYLGNGFICEGKIKLNLTILAITLITCYL